jgi:hypothetical protein
MATNNPDRVQDLIARCAALSATLDICLSELVRLYGDEARVKLEAIRDELIMRFKNSSIPANREMEHVAIVRPAIEVIQEHFSEALRGGR